MKVLIAFPSTEWCYASFALCFSGAIMYLQRQHPDWEIIPGNSQTCYIQNGRNSLAAQAVNTECDWAIMVDSDMMFPASTFDRLIAHDKDIVGVAYHRRRPPFGLLGRPVGVENGPVALSEGLAPFEWLATGITCFRVSMFTELEFPWFDCPRVKNPDGQYNFDAQGEDLYFMQKAFNAKREIFCDIDLSHQVSHLGVLPINGGIATLLNAKGAENVPELG